jgi:hypothetical protein
MRECCSTGAGKKAKACDLFEDYAKWAEDGGERAKLTRRQLCAELRDAGFLEGKNNGLWFLGIELLPSARGQVPRSGPVTRLEVPRSRPIGS